MKQKVVPTMMMTTMMMMKRKVTPTLQGQNHRQRRQKNTARVRTRLSMSSQNLRKEIGK